MEYALSDLEQVMEKLVADKEMSGGALIVRKNGQEVYRGKWGMADVMQQKPIEYNSMYHMASMTKPITAIGIMQLVDEQKIDIDDPISKYLPGFEKQQVCAKKISVYGQYEPDERFPEGMTIPELIGKIMTMPPVPIQRQVTIRDLLTHSSGMGMSLIGYTTVSMMLDTNDKLADRVKKWESLLLDFQPGTDTGYSTVVGFDILGRIIEVVSGMDLAEYFRTKIFEPLDIQDMCFIPNDEQSSRLVTMYHSENGKHYIEPGTYGWSGAFGTHMLVDPTNNINATFVMNRYNIGGAASPIARKLEELVVGIWKNPRI